MQYPDLEKHVELSEAFRLFVVTIGVELWSFGYILSSSIIVPIAVAIKDNQYIIRVEDKSTYSRPRNDDIHFSRVRPISSSFSEYVGFMHSSSKSYSQIISIHQAQKRSAVHCGLGMDQAVKYRPTSMSKSLSILTARPKVWMNCITLANSHMFRIFVMRGVSCVGAAAGSAASISSLVRLRGMMAAVMGREDCA
jgi:hypothetical protein